MSETQHPTEEFLDLLTESGEKTGISKSRKLVHRDGDFHRAVHVWFYAESTGELLLQRRRSRDSWPEQWDISSAGHVSAGDSSLMTARREVEEELGLRLPDDAFELLFVCFQQCIVSSRSFINNEYDDIYLVTTLDPIPLEAFTLEEKAITAVKYMNCLEYKRALETGDGHEYLPKDINGPYGQLFTIIEERYKENIESRSSSLQKQIQRYVPINFEPELSELSEGDKNALIYIIKAAMILDDIFYEQLCSTNPGLKSWLKNNADSSSIDRLKYTYYSINKGPWSCLDENKAFLTTADSAVKLLKDATKSVSGWKGIQYRAAFPLIKPPGSNFYPSDMDKNEFELWKKGLSGDELKDVNSSFSVIKRKGNKSYDLSAVPFSEEYKSSLKKASDLLIKASELSDTSSLKKLLKTRAEAFLSNSYYQSQLASMELDSKLYVKMGPSITTEDALFRYKAAFLVCIGIHDNSPTSQIKLFTDHLHELQRNLPVDDCYKTEIVKAPPIHVIQLLFNSGDVKGPQTAAFCFLNERFVSEHGASVVLLKNVSQAKFEHILQPIANVCIKDEQKEYIDFESFYTHVICHESCHGIGPRSIVLSSGQESTVKSELQEVYYAIEEAKADIVGLWSLKFLTEQGLLPHNLLKSTYVSFLAGCFRSVRFGLQEAHGKGQALQFNWLCEKGGFVLHSDGTFSVDFAKIEQAVESLSREILTIQAKGDKAGAKSLLERYAVMSQPLKCSLDKLENVQIPVDIAPIFTAANKLLENDS